PQWPVASRRQAVRLWSRLAGRFHVRSVWHGLRLLVRLLEQPILLVSADAALLADPIPFPQWCEALIYEASYQAGPETLAPSPTPPFSLVTTTQPSLESA